MDDGAHNSEAKPAASPAPVAAKRRWFRFSLRTLVLFVLLVGSGMLLWHNRASWVLKGIFDGYTGSLKSAAFSPDNQVVAVAGGELRVWDTATGQQLAELDGQPEEGMYHYVPMFSTDGRWLAAVAEDHPHIDKWALLWRTSDWTLVCKARGWEFDCRSRKFELQQFNISVHDGLVNVSLDPLPDGFNVSWLGLPPETHHGMEFKTSHTGCGVLYDRITGAVAFLPGHNKAFDVACAFSWDGEQIVTMDTYDTPFLWRRRRPEYWWGVAWLPEFWLTAVFAGAFVWSVWRDRKSL
ncbi:MAG: hypothetical protein NTW87_22025 [Planctomycetota bacterium]|nr:hypothetical protein [Planctomycetota bacterium]